MIGIACVDKNYYYASGPNSPLPWPTHESDLDWFKYITIDSTLLVGRNTFETLPKNLPKRRVLTIGRSGDYKCKDHFLKTYDYREKVFIAGGGKVWGDFKEDVDFFYLTVLNKVYVKNGICFPFLFEFKIPIVKKENYTVYKAFYKNNIVR